jgi:hypothetical protein
LTISINGPDLTAFVEEAFRVLVSGGTIEIWRTSGGAPELAAALTKAGFVEVRTGKGSLATGLAAIGKKP